MKRPVKSPRLLESKHDPLWALGVSLLIHGALLSPLWPWFDTNSSTDEILSGESTALVVQYIKVSPRPTPPSRVAELHQPQTEDEPTPAIPEREVADLTPPPDNREPDSRGPVEVTPEPQVLPTTAPVAASMGYADPAPSTSSPQLPIEPSAPGNQDGAASDSLHERYLSAIRQAVKLHWAGREVVPIGTCTLHIQQTAGGLVRSVSSGMCTLDDQTRRALENAPISAQPLPYAGFESVFQEQIVIEFSSQ